MINKAMRPTAVSMFSGCGGADLGLVQAGFEVVWANDFNDDACDTYESNIGPIHRGDVTLITPPQVENLDVLIAGFPCQPFSNAGSRKGVADPRGMLVEQTFKFIQTLNPKVVVFENVRGLLSSRIDGKPLIEYIRDRLETLGYAMEHRLLNFSHYGVPQNRIRVVIVAVPIEKSAVLGHLYPEVVTGKDLTIGATLKGLKQSLPNQKELMRLNPQAISLGSLIPEGGSWKNLSDDQIPERWLRIRKDMARYHYPNFFRRFARNEVQGTITAAFKPENAGVWHPTKKRIYSVREIARFQAFPDDFVFFGKSVKSKYQQIGNAIPPLFVKQLGQRIRLFLDDSPELGASSANYCFSKLNVNRPISEQKLQLQA